MKLKYAGCSHVGKRRAHNEDCFALEAEHWLFVVADGMGGHACGEVASSLAVETISEFFNDTSRQEDLTWPYSEDSQMSFQENRLSNGVKLANLHIYEKAQGDPKLRGMGTTVVALLFVEEEGAYAAHVGDSRIYLLQKDRLHQLTQDHSLLNDYLKIHPLTPEEIKHFPHKNVIVRALGMKDNIPVDIQQIVLQAGDLFVLCSDGLCGMLTDADMTAILVKERGDLAVACDKLIAAANEKGGHDNITVILVEVESV